MRAFLWAQAGAIAFSYAHTLMDWIVGLFGTDRAALSPLSALLLALNALIYAAWAVGLALALRGDRRWMAVVFVLTFGWTFLVSGVTIAYCLPPCDGLPPYGDIVHVGSLVFGVWASMLAWQRLAGDRAALRKGPALAAIALMIVTNVISSALAAEFIASQP